MCTSQTDSTFNLLAGLPAELRTAMEKNKLCNPGTLRSYPRSTSLGVSTGLSVTASSLSAGPVTPTLLFPTSALVLGNFERVSETSIEAEPEDLDGWTTVAEDVMERVGEDGEQSEGLTRTHAVRKGSKCSSVVPALTRKRFPTKVAAKIEPGETEKSAIRLDE